MSRMIPDKLVYFLKNGIKDADDGYEYASELNRILNSDECQTELSSKEIELLRDFAEKARRVGEIDFYSEERIKEVEKEYFGYKGISGFLGILDDIVKPQWPF